jgi:hypothetical protein
MCPSVKDTFPTLRPSGRATPNLCDRWALGRRLSRRARRLTCPRFLRGPAGRTGPVRPGGSALDFYAFVKRYGITKARLIEEALQHHLQSLREIPSDLVVPSRLVVTEDSMKRVAARLASDEQPTPALRELMGNAEK